MKFDDITVSFLESISADSKFTMDEIRKVLMKSRDSNKSDYCLFLNQISSSPAEDAKSLYEKLKSQNIPLMKDLTYKETVLSFNVNKEKIFKDILLTINEKGDDFGKNNVGAGKTVVIDFSSPNIAKLFHVGHFRTTVLGNFINNLMKASGYNSIALNYLGDWGKQFGLVLLGFDKFGDESKLKEDPLTHLFDVYVKINKLATEDPKVHEEARKIFKEMEEYKNEKYLSKWRKFRELSVEKYKKIYKQMNIEFDVYSGESFYNDGVKEFIENNEICKREDDGSCVIDCGEYGKALVSKSDGTTLYISRDIVAALDRIKTYKADKLIYVVSDEQDQHFQQLFHIMNAIGYPKQMFQHVNYGYVKGMSTRKGTVHFLEDIISSSAEVVKQKLLSDPEKEKQIEDKDSTANILALSTLLVSDFGAKRIKGYTFNIEQRANCEAGSGAYLQYTHCRLKSIEEKNPEIDLKSLSDADFKHIDSPEIHSLSYKLLWYEHLVQQCLEDYEPSRIVIYLMDLTKTVNSLINKLRVKDEPKDIAKARMAVLHSARIVIKNGLKLLGMVPLNKM